MKNVKLVYITAISGVKGSYPEAPEAKQTPVARSLDLRFGSIYAGKYSLIPNSSAETQGKFAIRYTVFIRCIF